MKRSHLYIGIAMMAMGAFCSCSNIMEESGLMKVKTGELCVELEADASLTVNTKANDVKEENIEANKGTLGFTMTAQPGTTVPSGTTLPTMAGTHKGIPVGSYSIVAKNDKTMTSDFAWNYPVLASTAQTVTVNPGTQTVALTCTLQNSIIAVDAAAWGTLLNDVDVTAFQVVNSATVPAQGTPIAGGTSLLASGSTSTLNSSVLYAKADLQNVKLVLDGTLKMGGKSFRAVADVKPAEGTGQIGSKNKYNISFSLDKTKGQLVLSITVDTSVTPIPIVIPIVPES